MPSSQHVAALAYLEAARVLGAEPTDAAAQELLIASEELERLIAAGLASGDADVRELASLQLALAAGVDMAAAADLLIQAQPGGGELRLNGALEASREVLLAEPAFGMRGLADEGRGLQGASPTTPQDLQAAAHDSIEAIAQQATEIAERCCDGLLDLAAGAVLDLVADAARVAADKLLGPLYHQASLRVRAALRLLSKALSKLLRAFGPGLDVARAWIVETLDKRFLGNPRHRAVRWALGVSAVDDDVRLRIDAAVATGIGPSAHMEAAYADLSRLPQRFERHRQAAELVAWALGPVATILGLVAAWAGPAVAGVYVLVLAYGLWVAGDYLDWLRVPLNGRLDLVAGVRSLVRDALVS